MSALLFGNRYKLDLLAALADAGKGGVSVSALAAAHKVPASVYYAPLKDLLEAGLAIRLAPVPGERRRWYVASKHRVWRTVRVLARELNDIERRTE